VALAAGAPLRAQTPEIDARVGHHYASELTEHGRTHGKRPKELTDAELTRRYEEANGEELPIRVDLIRQGARPRARGGKPPAPRWIAVGGSPTMPRPPSTRAFDGSVINGCSG